MIQYDFSYDGIATSVAGYAGEFAGEFDLDAIATEYRSALIEVLPEGVQLIGNDLRIDREIVGVDRDEVAARIYAEAERIDIGEIFQRHELPELTDADAEELAREIAGEVDNAGIDGATVTLWDRRVTVYPAGHEFRIEFQRMIDSMWGTWADCRDDERHGRADTDEATEAGTEFLRGVIEHHGEFYAVDRLSMVLDECGRDEKPYQVELTPAAAAWMAADGDEDAAWERESEVHEAAEEAFMDAARDRRDDIAAHVRLYTGGQALNAAQWNGNRLPDHREVANEERERQERELWDALAHVDVIEIDLDADSQIIARIA